MVDIIEKEFDVELSEDEAGFITMYLRMTREEENKVEETSVTMADIDYEINVSNETSGLSYYYDVYSNLEEFYEGFYLISDSIEQNDVIAYNLYYGLMEKARDKAIEIKVPEEYKEAHSHYLKGLNLYLEGTQKMFDGNTSFDIEDSNKSDELLTDASYEIGVYSDIISQNFENEYNLIASFVQSEYYFSTINVYAYNSNFTENENSVLFTMERAMVKIPELRNNLIGNAIRKESIANDKKALEEIKNTLENLAIEDENLSKYRDDILVQYNLYLENLYKVIEEFESKDVNEDVIKECASSLKDSSYDIFLATQGLSDFYSEKGYDIGFESAKESSTTQAQETTKAEESLEEETIQE